MAVIDESDADSVKKKKKGGIRETILLLAIGVGVALLLRTFVIGSFWIPSESMENTLVVGDRVIVNKLHGGVERGDVVVFKGWDGTDMIKRVVGLGGDVVASEGNGKPVTVNGAALEEKSYLFPEDFPSGDKFKETVPAGKLWLMGDHRSNSYDSRGHVAQGNGWISEDAVIGEAFALYWPFSRATFFSTPETFAKVR